MKYDDLISISNPYTVYTKFKKIYPPDSDIKISTMKTKKYIIWNPDKEKWFHFGSIMTDCTRHGDTKKTNYFFKKKQALG